MSRVLNVTCFVFLILINSTFSIVPKVKNIIYPHSTTAATSIFNNAFDTSNHCNHQNDHNESFPTQSQENQFISYVNLGADSFGDIMGQSEVGLMTGDIADTTISMIDFSPMERIVLTSNGNLQRIMNSYYGEKVTVKVIKCNQIDGNNFDRHVELYVNNKKFCTAIGKVIR